VIAASHYRTTGPAEGTKKWDKRQTLIAGHIEEASRDRVLLVVLSSHVETFLFFVIQGMIYCLCAKSGAVDLIERAATENETTEVLYAESHSWERGTQFFGV